MSNTDTISKLERLQKEAASLSPKPLARLKASMAAAELQRVWKSLPGSVRRGITRGRTV